jgi:hypothetical protein
MKTKDWTWTEHINFQSTVMISILMGKCINTKKENAELY